MTVEMWLENLAAFSLQIALLIAAGTLLVYVFRLKVPGVLLMFWQVLLAACLLLPAVQPWHRALLSPLPLLNSNVDPEPVLTISTPSTATIRSAPFSNYKAVAAVLGTGIAIRFVWIGIGLLRLSWYRRKSRRITAFPESIREMQRRVGVDTEILISSDINTPITFGWRRPAVIFPEFFMDMGEHMQKPIACHELLHVRRRDWLFIVFEEIVRSLLWFHPAVWWVLNRINLSREQVVDREVLRVTGERTSYLESLLHIASLRSRPVSVPAPLLLSEHNLFQRVTLLIKETTMTRKRLMVSLVSISIVLLWTGTLAAGWFPLNAPPVLPTAIPVATTQGSESVSALAASIPSTPQPPPAQEPIVMIGYDNADLRAAILVFAKNLGLDPIEVDSQVQGRVTINGRFTRPELLKAFNQMLLDNKAELTKTSNGYKVIYVATPARPVAVDVQTKIISLNMKMMRTPDPGQSQTSNEKLDREPIRVGENVQESKLIHKVEPVYPEAAKQARVSGAVILTITVDEQGNVAGIKEIRGHPLLNSAAIEAVKQWRYSPTYLNGKAVPVIATVTVIFNDRQASVSGSGSVGPGIGAGVSSDIQNPSPMPIRVGASVQESKLIYMVEPVYPEAARQARVSGAVILTITVDEQGNVADAKVLRGHPLLDDAAIEAVRQWRYSPTYLNGKAVSVMCTVTVIFNSAMAQLLLDANGNLLGMDQAPVALEDLVQAGKNAVRISPQPTIRFDVLSEALKTIQARIPDIQLSSMTYVFQAGELFYAPNALVGSQRLQNPEISIDIGLLTAMVKASGMAAGSTQTLFLQYLLCISETGDVVAASPRGGPDIPGIEAALLQARVLSPGRLGGQAVPAAASVIVPIK